MRKGALASGIASLTLAALCAAATSAFAAWKTDTPLPVSYYQTKAVAGNGYVYKLGGLGAKAICGTRDVYYAPINADGSVGAWTQTTSLPSVGASTMTWTCANTQYVVDDVVIGWGYEAVFWNGFVYVIGGNRWSFAGFPDGARIHFSGDVYYAPVNSDGSLGSWKYGTSLSTASFDAAGTVDNGTIYVTGGRDDSSTVNVRRDVFYSRLNPDGSLGTWQASANQLPGGLWMHAAAAAGGRLYVGGGVTYYPFPPNQVTNAVFSAPLAADGTPGAWRGESSLPIGLAGHALKPRHGVLYSIGGEEPTTPSVSVHVSSINADGTLPAWTDADSLPAPLYLHGAAALGGAVYADGGTDGNTPQVGVYRLPDAIPPSAVANLAAAPSAGSALTLSWTAPGNDGAYGAVSGGSYRLRAAADPSQLSAVAPTTWTASFAPGDAQVRRLAGLAPGTTYYLSIAAVDEAGNVAPPSNVAAAQTYFLAASPENPPVAKLESPVPGLTISPLSSAQSASALASAPGASLVALYQIAPPAGLSPGLLTVAIAASALAPGVALYAYDGVAWSSAAVAAQAVDATAGLLRGTLAKTATVGVFGPWPVPSASSLSPALVVAGASGLALTVNGAGFAPTSVVQWNGSARPTTYVSSTQLTAAVSAADLAAPGSAAVTVATPAPGGGTSAPTPFTIANPAPAVASLSPSSATAGAGGFLLTTNGSGFVSGSVVQWNGAARATAFVSASQLTAAISAADVAAAGGAAVAVFTPAPGGGTSATAAFAILNPAPVVSSLSPASAVAGGPAFALTVDGSGFVSGSVVQWNGASRATTFVSSAQVVAAISSSDVAAAGGASVAVLTPAPGGGVSSPLSLAVANPAPLLASLSPASAVAGASGFTLTASGSGFVSGSVVQWNGAPRATTFVSASQLSAAISAADVAAAGSASVAVFTPAPGGGASAAASFAILNPAPLVSSLSPASIVAGAPAFALTVNGSGFVSGSVVQWNGAPRATTFVSASQLSAAISAADVAAAGSASVAVFTPAPGGGASAAVSFTAANPVPAISSLAPNAANAGGGAFTLTVNGSGFVSGSVVQWNGAARPTTFVSGSQLTAAISAADIAAAGGASVAVVSPAPGGGTSAAAAFTVAVPPPLAPVLSAIGPSVVSAGAAAFTLTAGGANFTSASVVQWNGSARATTFVSSAQIAAAVSAADVATAGSESITVFTPAPGGGLSSPLTLTVVNPAPVLASLAPASAVAGASGLTLTASGSGFVAGSVVQWNGAARPTTFVSASQLSAAISAADVAAAGGASVAVVSPAPGGGTSAAAAFTVLNPAPAVSALSPASAAAGAPAFALTVNGSGFVSGSVVQWNGAARATTFVSASQLAAAISSADVAAAGSASVAVLTPAPGGGLSSPLTLTVVNPAPVLASLAPASAVAGAPAFALTVNGSGFVSGSVVQWNGAARATTFVSASQLSAAISPADVAVAGSASVAVLTPAPGGGTSAAAAFAVLNPAPAVSALSPASSAAGAPAFALTVNGSGFVSGSVVQWNGAARATTFVSASQLAAAISSTDVAAAGSASVAVLTPAPGGGASAAAAFAVLNPAPAVSALSPASSVAGAPAFTLTVNGSGFVSGSVVQWNGAPRATTFVSASQLAAAISSADVSAAGSIPVAVFTPAPGGGTSTAALFTTSAPAPPAPVFEAELEPASLNLGSNGRYVHATLEAESWARSADVVAASVRLTAVDGRPVAPLAALSCALGDSDGDGAPDQDCAFDRAAVERLLTPGQHALTFAGALQDGRSFAASAALNAIQPQERRAMSAAAFRAAAAPEPAPTDAPRFWPAPARLMVLRTMAWDADPPLVPVANSVVSGRVAVRLPDGAIAPSVALTISTAAAAAAPDLGRRAAKSAAAGLAPAAPAVSFGPEGTRFATPVTLELPYDRAGLPAGTDEGALAVHYWNPATSAWEKLPSFVDRAAQLVRAQTGHFSVYQVFAAAAPSAPVLPAAADPALSFKAAYAFPNPVRGVSAVTIRAQPGSADSVEVHIYDLAGRRVHASSDFASRGAFDDGNGLGAQFTYDHVWDVSGVGSGVYTYVITARKAGQPDVHKSGKIGVVK